MTADSVEESDKSMQSKKASFFRKLADNSPLFIGMCDMQFVPFYVNRAGRRLVGLEDLEHFQRTPVQEFFFPEDQSFIVNEFFPRVRKEGRAETEIRFRHFKTGEAIWMTYDVFFLEDEDGKPAGLATVSRDISERKRVEEALRESEERFTSFMRHLPGLAWIKDLDGRYSFVNDAAEKAFQLPRNKLLGKLDEEIFPAETATQFHANDIEALTSGGGVTSIETLYHDDEILHHSLVSKFPIRDASGTIRAIGGVAIDVTDRVNAELKLQEVAERLRSADRFKDEFLAILAHELRNPLAPIRNGLHVLRTLTESEPKIRRIEDIMERQLSHLIRLVDDLLDVARINSGKITIRKEMVDLRTIVDQAVDMSRQGFDAAGLNLDVNVPGATLFVDGDPVRLTQIISNLLNNAAKFTPRNGRVMIDAKRSAGEVVVRVVDNGIGIKGEVLPHIFDMFTQGIHETNGTKSGLGIGLSLVRRLVELHGGSVEAYSEGENFGSTFTVRLPAEKIFADDALSQ
jgi:PAS domain S-box-containing protein